MELAINRLVGRAEYADYIVNSLAPRVPKLREKFWQKDRIPSCYLDNLLPEKLVSQIFEAFPNPTEMMERKTLREHKYVTAQLNRCSPVMEEIVYAFQDPRVLDLVEQVTGIRQMFPDELLYAGGISLMGQGHFLNPHLDNSHDNERETYRVLNLLYYVSPGWKSDFGGNLELWDNGPGGEPREIASCNNRLVLMATHKTSWHSVSRVRVAHPPRCCVSNYYFSRISLEQADYFHITTFRGRPEEPVRNAMLKVDAMLRSGVRKIFKKGAVKNKHIYNKSES